MGVGAWTSPALPPGGPFAASCFVPDACISPHPRFGALTRNIRHRRGAKVAIYMPLFRDEATPAAVLADAQCAPEDAEAEGEGSPAFYTSASSHPNDLRATIATQRAAAVQTAHARAASAAAPDSDASAAAARASAAATVAASPALSIGSSNGSNITSATASPTSVLNGNVPHSGSATDAASADRGPKGPGFASSTRAACVDAHVGPSSLPVAGQSGCSNCFIDDC